MAKERYLINEAAKEVHVESHVLRYWEEELNLPIGRNEQGHRIYTKADIERFVRIKNLKDQGLQLKAVRTLMDSTDGENQISRISKSREIRIVPMKNEEEQSRRLQYLFQKLIKEAVAENNDELAGKLADKVSENVKDDIVKELDYQFRLMDERDEERESLKLKNEDKRNEEYYKRIDELLRQYSIKNMKQKDKNKDKTIKFPETKTKEKDIKTKKEFHLFKKSKKNAAL
jgi:DNA-binding transcriptional MerR regulator